MRKILFLLLLGSLSSGCATIIDGRHQDISIDSYPSGARVVRDGIEVGQTPCVISVPRWTNGEYTLEKPGYSPRTIRLERVVNPMVLLDFPWFLAGIAPGFVALAVDGFSGAIFEFDPASAMVRLKLPQNSSSIRRSSSPELKKPPRRPPTKSH